MAPCTSFSYYYYYYYVIYWRVHCKYVAYYTVSQKTRQLWQKLIFIFFFGKQHQHTFKNDMHVQLSLPLHFYLLYFLLHSCDGNEAFWCNRDFTVCL